MNEWYSLKLVFGQNQMEAEMVSETKIYQVVVVVV